MARRKKQTDPEDEWQDDHDSVADEYEERLRHKQHKQMLRELRREKRKRLEEGQ